jgi:steroid delta-isomerase-like uncharacterized protein
MAQATPDVERVVSDYEDLWNGDLSKLDVVSESFAFYAPVDEIHGRDALEAFLREQTAAFPDIEYETHDTLVGDELVMQDWTWRGTHEGEFADVQPTGEEVVLRGMHKLVIEDGKVQEDWTYFDSRDFVG